MKREKKRARPAKQDGIYEDALPAQRPHLLIAFRNGSLPLPLCGRGQLARDDFEARDGAVLKQLRHGPIEIIKIIDDLLPMNFNISRSRRPEHGKPRRSKIFPRATHITYTHIGKARCYQVCFILGPAGQLSTLADKIFNSNRGELLLKVLKTIM